MVSARENVAGEKDAGKKGQKGELDGFGLRLGFAGDQNSNGKGNEEIGNGKESQKKDAAVNGDLKDEAHEGNNRTKFRKPDR